MFQIHSRFLYFLLLYMETLCVSENVNIMKYTKKDIGVMILVVSYVTLAILLTIEAVMIYSEIFSSMV